MAAYVLVHGMGLGGWCWSRVSDLLREAGHQVFTPSLTGLAERSHLATPEVNLDTHINDVANVIHWEGLDDVILVGHSYGGSVVTGAADQCAKKIKRLVYLDAFILQDGESVISLQPPERVEHYEKLIKEEGDGWLLRPNSAEFYGLTDPQDQQWIDSLSVPQPCQTFRQAIRLKNSGTPEFPRSYIWASGFSQGPFTQFAAQVKNDPSWDYHEISGAHMLMTSHPLEVTDILMKFA